MWNVLVWYLGNFNILKEIFNILWIENYHVLLIQTNISGYMSYSKYSFGCCSIHNNLSQTVSLTLSWSLSYPTYFVIYHSGATNT